MNERLSIKLIILYIVFLIAISGCSTGYQLRTGSHNINHLKVYFLDIGQGDSTLLILPDETTILVDTGSPAGAPLLIDHLNNFNVKTIDHLILTHPHDDHIGGVFHALHECKVHHVYDNGYDNHQSTLYHDYIQSVRKSPITYTVLQAEDTMEFGDVKISVLNPILPLTKRINDDSIVLRISHGNINILLTGDIGRTGENRIMSTGLDLTSAILKAGHHGDRNASTDLFLRTVKPEVSVISVGADNKYAKPHADALDRMKAAGAQIFRTDLHGTVLMESDGNKYTIRRSRNQPDN